MTPLKHTCCLVPILRNHFGIKTTKFSHTEHLKSSQEAVPKAEVMAGPCLPSRSRCHGVPTQCPLGHQLPDTIPSTVVQNPQCVSYASGVHLAQGNIWLTRSFPCLLGRRLGRRSQVRCDFSSCSPLQPSYSRGLAFWCTGGPQPRAKPLHMPHLKSRNAHGVLRMSLATALHRACGSR